MSFIKKNLIYKEKAGTVTKVNYVMKIKVSGKLPPGKFPLRKFSPIKLPLVNSPPENSHPKNSHVENFCLCF